MTLRSPSEKLESNAIKKFKTGKLLPNWPHLAANPLACSGRKCCGSFWPQLKWPYVAANSHQVTESAKPTNSQDPNNET
jgi:hypothetical protein